MARSHRSRTTPLGAMLRSPIHGFATRQRSNTS